MKSNFYKPLRPGRLNAGKLRTGILFKLLLALLIGTASADEASASNKTPKPINGKQIKAGRAGIMRTMNCAAPTVIASGSTTLCAGGNVTLSAPSFITTVSTFAGSTAGNTDASGTAAQFTDPFGTAFDAAGNLYVAEQDNHRIRKITPAGVVTTLAGSTRGFTNGTGAAARFNNPSGLAVDASGNVFVTDWGNEAIRKITPEGLVTTFAGGTRGTADGTGTAAQFVKPFALAFDPAGNLIIADCDDGLIRKITPAGVVTTIAGGTRGSADGNGTAAQFYYPSGIAVDAAGIIYVADNGNGLIRKINQAGDVTAVNRGGTSVSAYGIALDGAGNLYCAEIYNNRISKVSAAGVVSTYAGSTPGFAEGPVSIALFNNPSGVAADAEGNVFVADQGNNRIRKIIPAANADSYIWSNGSAEQSIIVNSNQSGSYTVQAVKGTCTSDASAPVVVSVTSFTTPVITAAGSTALCSGSNVTLSAPALTTMVSTVAGGNEGYYNASGADAMFNLPYGIAVDATGNLYVADYNNSSIRKVTPGGVVSTLAGNGTAGFAEGTGTAAQFNYANGVAVDAAGFVYVADQSNNRIRKITPGGLVSTFAGSGAGGFADGTGAAAQFNGPNGVAVDASGNVYVADGSNNSIRKITPGGTVSTLAGGGSAGFADGIGAAAQFNSPISVAVDASGNVYVSDAGNSSIRKITPGGVVSTLAGNGSAGFTEGMGAAAQFNYPTGLTLDAAGNVYVGDLFNNRIRKITPEGLVSTYSGSEGDFIDGAVDVARFKGPNGLAFDASGNLYVADEYNNSIRKIVPAATVDSYLWSNGITAQSISLSTSDLGSYTVQGIQGSCTSASSPAVVVSLLAAPVITAPSGTANCGSSRVSLTISPVQGAVSYLWNDRDHSTGLTISASSPGSYKVRALNSDGCISSFSNIVSVSSGTSPGIPTIQTPVSTIICSGGQLTLQVLADPGVSGYIWSDGITTGTTLSVTTAGSYSVRAINGACTSGVSNVITLTASPAPNVPSISASGSTAFCAGGSVNLYATSVDPGTTYIWNDGLTNNSSITATQAGNYSLQAISNGCTSAASNVIVVTLNTPAGPVITSPSTYNCNGAAIQITAAEVSGATDYIWSDGVTHGNIFDATVSGTYSVRSISAGCTSAASNEIAVTIFQLHDPSTPDIQTSQSTITCGDNINVPFTVINPVDGVVYLWSDGVTTGNSFTATQAGSVYVNHITDGCTADVHHSIMVWNYPAISAPEITALSETNICGDGSVTLQATNGEAGTQFLWSDGVTTGNTFQATATGTYSVQSFNETCTSAASNAIEVIVNPVPSAPTISGSASAICEGGSAILTASGNTGFYLWSTGSIDQQITVNEAGNYTVQALNGNCFSENSAVFNVRVITGKPVISTDYRARFCENEYTVLRSASGLAGQWLLNGQPLIYTNEFNATQSGEYTFQDINSLCQLVSDPITLTVDPVPTKPTISGPTSVCNGGAIVLTSSSPNGNRWRGLNNQRIYFDYSTPYATIYEPGNYTLEVLSDYCTSPVSEVFVVEAATPLPAPTILGAATFCEGGYTVLTSSATEGTNFWNIGNQGVNYESGEQLIVSEPGIYTLQSVINGCLSASSEVFTVSVTAIPGPPVITSASTELSNGGSITLTAGEVYGATDYMWSDNLTTGLTFEATTAGSYTVQAINGTCTSAASNVIVITDAPAACDAPVVTASGALEFCEGGSVTLTGPEAQPAIVSTVGGNYLTNYSDGPYSGSFVNSNNEVYDNSLNQYSVSSNSIIKRTFFGNTTVFAGSAQPGYADGFGTDGRFNLITSLVIDAVGNLFVADYNNRLIRKITPDGYVSTYAGIRGNSLSYNGPATTAAMGLPKQLSYNFNGSLYVADYGSHTVRKITPGVTTEYIWSGAVSANTQTIEATASGSYILQTVIEGCTSYASVPVEITVNAPSAGPVINTPVQTTACAPQGITLTISPVAGATGYIWSDNVSTDLSFTAYQSGSYSVRSITNGCTSLSSEPVEVTISDVAPAPYVQRYNFMCAGGEIVLTSSSPTGNLWSTGETTASITITEPGDYTLTNTEAGPCGSETAVATVIERGVYPAEAIQGSATGITGNTQQYFTNGAEGALDFIWSYTGTGVEIIPTADWRYVNLKFLENATTGVLSVRVPMECGESPATTFEITSVITPVDLLISSNTTVQGAYRNITVSGTPVITLDGPLTLTGNLTVPAGATFETGSYTTDGVGSFTLAAGAMFITANADGVALTSTRGAIRTETYSFSPDADYEFNGSQGQITGLLPAKVRNLTISNSEYVLVSSWSGVTRILTLNAGVFYGANSFIIFSDASGTGMVVNNGGVSLSNILVQRYITADVNPGMGYRHYSSAVAENNLANLTSNAETFLPVLNTEYNTAANPSAVTPYPNVFTFDESRITAGSDLFNNGWAVPEGNMIPGTGYSVNIAASQTLQVRGELNNGPYNVTVPNGGLNNSGWMLTGNPYPAPINWDLTDKTGMQNAIYMVQSTGQYTSRYASYVNGLGNNGGTAIIPSMQGFFVRSNIGGGSISFTNDARLTTYADPEFRRTAADQTLVRLSIASAGSHADETTVYFQEGNTAAYDADRDAGKVNGGGLSLYSFGPNQNYSINGLPSEMLNTTETRIGLGYVASGTGAHTISLAAGDDQWFIFDAQDNRLHNMPYTFTSAAAARYNSRFQLVRTNSVTAIAKAAVQLNMYPNPTEGNIHLTLPGVSTLKLYDITGKEIMTATMNNETDLDLANFASGVYTLRCTNAAGTSVHKVVKQ
ncbi:MAG: T9SS type A sorting domain-containing protein [Bacteroidota bacterium]